MDDDTPHGSPSNGRVDRRTFIKVAGASGATAGLAGCLGGDGGDGGDGGGTTGSGGGGGGGGASGTVQWGFDPTQAQDASSEIKQLFHDHGLSDDITLELVPGNADTGQRQSKYNQVLNAQQSQPDMFMMDSGWTIPFIAREQLLNLTDNLSQEQLDQVNNDYFQASVNTARGQNGDLFGVPLFPDFPSIQYRKDLVTDAGYDPEGENWATEPMTWKEFSKIVADVKEQTDVGQGFVFQFDVYEGLSCCDFNEFMSSWGGAYFGGRDNLFGPVGERPVTVDAKPVVDSVRMVRTFIHGSEDPEALSDYGGGISPTNVLSWQEQDTLTAMTNGNAIFQRNWPYAIANLAAEDQYGQDLGVMPIPYAVTENNAQAQGMGGTSAALGGWNMVVNPNAENLEAALEVIKVAMKDELQLGLLGITGWLPPQPKLFESEEAKQQKPIGRYMDTLQVAGKNAVPRPVTVAWPQESDIIAQEVNAAATQEKAPSDALGSLKSQIESIENEIAGS